MTLPIAAALNELSRLWPFAVSNERPCGPTMLLRVRPRAPELALARFRKSELSATVSPGVELLRLAEPFCPTTRASPAAGLWDWHRHGTQPWWEAAEGTR